MARAVSELESSSLKGPMTSELTADARQTRKRFLELVADVRPQLHRYCARMAGSIPDGEDIVQEALARAYFSLPEHEEMPPLRPWLFRIARIPSNRCSPYRRSSVVTRSCSTPVIGTEFARCWVKTSA